MGGWDPRADAWLAGFIDGEGHFCVRTDGSPRFVIQLRADDAAVLETVAEVFGGSLHKRPAHNGAPGIQWAVVAKRDLAGLVTYLDRWPLRAKKRRDYDIWREAVLVFTAHGRTAPELLTLRAALMEGRAYAPEAEPQIVELPEATQLALA